MSRIMKYQPGFTAIELLITLFVAALFLLTGYQLFTVIVNDSGNTRAESRASNIAYDYLRRYSDAATNPCTASTPLSNEPLTVDDLTDVTISITITCPTSGVTSLSKVESVIDYGKPTKTVRYGIFVDKSKGATPMGSVTNNFIAKLLINQGKVTHA